MDQADSAGAEAAAVYFLNLYAYVYATNDLTEWRELSHAECVFCASVVTNVEKQVAAGNRSEGGLVEFESVAGVEVSEDFFSVEALVNQSPGLEYGPDGSLVDETPGERSLVTLVILRDQTNWVVREAQVDEAPAT